MFAFAISRSILTLLLISIGLTGCTQIITTDSDTSPQTPNISPTESLSAEACPVTEPVQTKPPEDAAVQGEPEVGSYYLNEDLSIWASAWWAETGDFPLRADEDGVKVGWFRPAGATLEITGRRLDGSASPLEVHVPCCYPTRFQATGLYFPTPGCWEVTAKAAKSELSFVVWVEP
jgi:hypothetical protein